AGVSRWLELPEGSCASYRRRGVSLRLGALRARDQGKARDYQDDVSVVHTAARARAAGERWRTSLDPLAPAVSRPASRRRARVDRGPVPPPPHRVAPFQARPPALLLLRLYRAADRPAGLRLYDLP